MLFQEYVATIGPPKKDAIKTDRAARKTGAPRDPFATTRARVRAVRNIEQAERVLGSPLNFKKDVWPAVVANLGRYTEAQWRALTKPDDLVPKTAKGRK